MARSPSPLPPVLNDRQRRYMLAAYQLDQQLESAHKYDYHRGVTTPASEWRLMPYGRWQHYLGKPPTDLRKVIEQEQGTSPRRLIDPGAGSTWKALAERGLVEIEERVIINHPNPRIGYSLPHIRLTPAGRKLVRQLTGEVRPPRARPSKPPLPEGLLTHQGWRTLALVYAQDAEGFPVPDRTSFQYHPLQHTVLQQLHRNGLVAGWPDGPPIADQPYAKYVITAQGRDYYARYYRLNTAAYGGTWAELPRPMLTPAQHAFWQRMQELGWQRDVAGSNTALRAARRRELLALQLAQPVAALYAEPHWYPTLAGQPITTTHHQSPEEFCCATEAEALRRGQELQARWRQQLAALAAELS